MPRDTADRIRARRAKLEAELQALREAEERENERRSTIAGRAVLARAEEDPAFRETLMAVLDRALTRKRERQLFGLSQTPKRPKTPSAEAAAAEPIRSGATAPAEPAPS